MPRSLVLQLLDNLVDMAKSGMIFESIGKAKEYVSRFGRAAFETSLLTYLIVGLTRFWLSYREG